jgi:hypothetical protein
MQNVNKPRRPLSLRTQTLRQLATTDLSIVVGGQASAKTIPCSIPCSDICSSGL